MKKMNVQRGDAMVILVVVLAVALVGVVGWVAYDKMFSTQDTAEVAQKSDESSGEIVTKMKEVCVPHEQLCFEYPSEWTLNVGEVDKEYIGGEYAGVKGDVVTILSPTDSIEINLNTNMGGMGYACDSNLHSKYYRLRSQATELTGYSPGEYSYDTVRAMALVASNSGETQFTISAVLSHGRVLIDNEVSGYCDNAFSMLIPGKSTDVGSFYFEARDISGGMNDDGNAVSTSYSSLSEAKKALESEEWKQAFDILASAHYK